MLDVADTEINKTKATLDLESEIELKLLLTKPGTGFLNSSPDGQREPSGQ